MKFQILLLAALLSLTTTVSAAPESFTWGGTDGLGRALPAVPEKKDRKERKVAVFYWLWHYNFAGGLPYNNSEILAENPEARNDFEHPAWQGTPSGTPHFWGKPLFGYYTNLDSWVVAKHAVMLADAGVDAIIFDCTNGTFTWMPAVEVLCKTFQKMKEKGVHVPQIAFMLNFAPNSESAAELRQLYKDIYAPGLYRELWFEWQGKPLIMAHPEALDAKNPADAEILRFFTFRRNEPTYFAKDTPLKDNRWGWCSVYPQTRFGTNSGKIEEMTVSVAQNAGKNGLCAMNDSRVEVFGRGYTKGKYTAVFPMRSNIFSRVNSKSPEAWLWGLNFQHQFDYAVQEDPDLIFVTGWNEWIAGRHSEWLGTKNAFPDQFLPEFSRDIEPAENPPYDHFYFQLAANIRRYKGNAGLPPKTPFASNPPAKGLDSWKKIPVLFTDPAECMERNSPGWKGTSYKSPLPPNDMIVAKASFDRENLYFYLKCANSIKPDTHLRLLLDLHGSGWEGFDFVVQRNKNGKFELMRLKPGKTFAPERIAGISFCISGSEAAVEIPLKKLGLSAGFTTPVQFKWSDEQNLEKSVLTFYSEGDTAPNGRFRYILVP